jgi:hypothetical protein
MIDSMILKEHLGINYYDIDEFPYIQRKRIIKVIADAIEEANKESK